MSEHDPVVRSDALDERLSQDPVVLNLVKMSQQHARIIHWLVVSVVLDIALSIGLALLAWNAHDVARTAASASSQARVNCLAGNQARTSQKQLWAYLLTITPVVHETTPEHRARQVEIAKFQAYIHKAFALRDCSKSTLAGQGMTLSIPSAVPSGFVSPSVAAGVTPTPGVLVPPHAVGDEHPEISAQPRRHPRRRRSSPSPRATPSMTPSPTSSPSPSPRCLPLIRICRGFQ